MDSVMKKKVQRKFKIRGFNLKVGALEEAILFISHFPGEEDEALDILIDQIDKDSSKSSILDKETVGRVVSLLLEAESAVDPTSPAGNCTALRVIDAFVVPKFKYDPIKNVFYAHSGKLALHGDAADKGALYKDRYQLLLQRLSRDKYFSKPAFAIQSLEDDETCEITAIQSLIGCKGRRWIAGIISQLQEGQFYLEDSTAAVPIDLLNTKVTSGFFAENTLIVAEGELQTNGIFKVNTCGFPPIEERETSLSLLRGLDFFGAGIISPEETMRLAELEERAINDMFVIISDIWLDNEETMQKLEVVLDGYESVEVVPCLFVFMGNFCSRPCNLSYYSFSDLRMQFRKLGEMIEARPRIKENSRFLFIPGPDDAVPSQVLPLAPLPKCLTEEIQNLVPNAIFSTNPCRIKYYTQEIIFFRQDLLYRMRRACIVPPTNEETSDSFEHLVATIIHQSHLCPLPLTVQPIYWNYDHALRLYPTPHTIVLGDKSEQKAFKYTGTTCFNPGSFSSDSTFAVYRPCTKEVELSALET